MKPSWTASQAEYDTKHSFQSWKGLADKVGKGHHSEGRGNDGTCDLMCLSFCQTQIGSVVKAEVVGWGSAGLPGHP